jgi:hypothetical protein
MGGGGALANMVMNRRNPENVGKVLSAAALASKY